MADALAAVLLGLPLTLLVTAAAFSIGLVAGVPVLLALRSRFRPLALAMRFAVDLIRGIPPIVWLFLLYFGVSIGTIRLDALTAAILGLGIISSAYIAEMYRGGFAMVPRGQSEAAAALGLARRTSFAMVLAPQAVRTAVPSLTTYLLSLLKDSSIASTIGVADMVFAATMFARQNPTTAGIVPFFLAAGVYLVVSVPVAVVARRLDARFRKDVR